MTGADGHHALLSWAEIDPDFGRAAVLLAVSIDDSPLDRAGPQVVLPQDRCGARHISGISEIRVDGGYTSWTAHRGKELGEPGGSDGRPGRGAHPAGA